MSDDRALSGIRVLDLTSVVVGPSATLRLADLGAEVIKIEPPGGDVLRTLGGPSPSGSLSGKYLHFNRAKRSVCLDLRREQARRVLDDMLSSCDVFVSNMRPDALARLGLDGERCLARHPSLIHCSITGFGAAGPYAGRPAYDSVVQGVSGIAGLSLRRDGVPRYVPMVICDHTVGEITAGAICAALFKRLRTGIGSVLEIPMFETMAAFVLQEHLGPSSFHPPLGPAGDTRVLDPNNMPVATADGWISISANTDAQAAGFLRAIGRPELIDDERFRSVAARFRNANGWFDLRANALRERPTAHWLAAFAEVDVPAMVCHTLETLPADEHLTAVGLASTEHHVTEGDVTTLRSSILIDGASPPPGHAAQPLGWDTRAVLAELGIPSAEIDALIADGAARDGRAARQAAEVV
ncbi:CaiB/BaiF CoA transferase family protein [Faunimonas sp. B44]|uniref:CaiB/BaiF CoA transferase family protein n=1 Tax=Faunimonas sp. B44 TaxID=3461493 RepID=UPI004044FBE8